VSEDPGVRKMVARTRVDTAAGRGGGGGQSWSWSARAPVSLGGGDGRVDEATVLGSSHGRASVSGRGGVVEAVEVG